MEIEETEQNDDYKFKEAVRMIQGGLTMSAAARDQGINKGLLSAYYRGFLFGKDKATSPVKPPFNAPSRDLPEAPEEAIPWKKIAALGALVFFLTIFVLRLIFR